MRTIDVHEVIDNARFNRFHWMVLFWCALIIIFDGYDLVIYGVVLPVLMKEWNLSPLEAGALGSYALFGMMAGALIFGPLSDKIGRKPIILGGCLIAALTYFPLFHALTNAANPQLAAATAGLLAAAIGLTLFLAWVHKQEQHER